MATPGPASRPNLQVVREGNQGHHPQERFEGGLALPVEAPDEPDWTDWWPSVRIPKVAKLRREHNLELLEGELVHIENDAKRQRLAKARQTWLVNRDKDQARRSQADNRRCREIARTVWRRVVPILEKYGTLATIDEDILIDLCMTRARIDQCERNISELGIWQRGERGAMKNPATTVLNQLRGHWKFLVGELGLSPVARDALNPRGVDGDGDDPFD